MAEEVKICMRCNHVDVLHSPGGTCNYICTLEPVKIVDACSCCNYFNKKVKDNLKEEENK